MSNFGDSYPMAQRSPMPSPASVSGSEQTAVESAPQSPTIRECLQCARYLEIHGKGEGELPEVPCHGWPELVGVMVNNPDFESFQTFRSLNIKSLLYYQAELADLEKQLHQQEWRDHQNGAFQTSEILSENIKTLLNTDIARSAQENRQKRGEQMKLMKTIRKTLKEYSKMVPELLSVLANIYSKIKHYYSTASSMISRSRTSSMSIV
jgi:hypothetical protein